MSVSIASDAVIQSRRASFSQSEPGPGAWSNRGAIRRCAASPPGSENATVRGTGTSRQTTLSSDRAPAPQRPRPLPNQHPPWMRMGSDHPSKLMPGRLSRA